MRRAIIGITAMTAVLLSGCSAGDAAALRAAPSATPPARTAPPPAPSPTALGPAGVRPGAGEVTPIERSGNLPPVISSIPTKRKVVFLTIDDGWEQDPGFLAQVKAERIPITVFATRDAVEAKGDPGEDLGWRFVGAGGWPYMRDLGVPVENHTLTHPDLRLLGADAQKKEICGAARVIKQEIGVRPGLLRPPFGSYNSVTLQAAKECGTRAIVLWTASVQPGGKIAYQTPDKKLHPGDILLIHFRPGLARDFRVLVNKIRRRGFALGDLHAYLDAAGVSARR